MRISSEKYEPSQKEKNKQITDWILKILKNRVEPTEEKKLVNMVYIYCNEIVPYSLIIELKRNNLIMITEGKWALKKEQCRSCQHTMNL